MAHTQGPWVFEKLGSSYIIGRSLDGEEWDEKVGQFFGEQDNSDADARLIAAAPDLLAALQRAREELAWFANEHQCCKLTDGVMDAIDSALKKATQP